MMTPNMMRQLWSLVEASQPSHIQAMDDGGLVKWLISQMNDQDALRGRSPQDQHILERYIRDHLLLIRDIADAAWCDEPFAALASC